MKKIVFLLCVFLFACTTAKPPVPNPEQVYKEAELAYKNKDFNGAVETYKKVKDLFPEHPLVQIAQLQIAEAHFNADQFEEAIVAYDEFTKLYPGNINVPYARFKEALCYYNQISEADRDQSMTKKAIEKFNKVINDFPDSPYAVKAYSYVKFCRKRMAEQEIFVGKFYLKSEKFNAAEKRFLYVLKNFYDVEIQEEAMVGLYNVYKLTGQTTKAEEVKETLEFFFPKSPYKKNM